VKILICFLFLLGVHVFADGFALMGANGRIVKDTTGEFELQVPMLIAGGYKHAPWMFMGDLTYHKDTSAEGGLSIENKQYEFTLSAAYFVDYEDERFLNPYVTVGLGAFKSHLKYDFSGASRKEDSLWEPILKVGGGVWAEVSRHFVINIEGKGIYSDKINPKLTFETSLRFGLIF
jgi:opacity protein-like surface antigen